jgi:hypothetical protein
MLATKPAGTHPSYNLAAATTDLMWACALATARVTVASTARGLELWSQMLRAPAGQLPLRLAAASGPGRDLPPEPTSAAATPEQESAAAGAAPGEPIAFASYRSAGGHAAAQVTGTS